jgi:hypothetical protein
MSRENEKNYVFFERLFVVKKIKPASKYLQADFHE